MDPLNKKDFQEILEKTLDQKLDKKFKEFRKVIREDMIEVFNDGFNELASPRLYEAEDKILDNEKRIQRLESKQVIS